MSHSHRVGGGGSGPPGDQGKRRLSSGQEQRDGGSLDPSKRDPRSEYPQSNTATQPVPPERHRRQTARADDGEFRRTVWAAVAQGLVREALELILRVFWPPGLW